MTEASTSLGSSTGSDGTSSSTSSRGAAQSESLSTTGAAIWDVVRDSVAAFLLPSTTLLTLRYDAAHGYRDTLEALAAAHRHYCECYRLALVAAPPLPLLPHYRNLHRDLTEDWHSGYEDWCFQTTLDR
jgi:hypothetical protein